MTGSEHYNSPGELLRAFEHRAKKRFGQHFLTDPNILNSIVESAHVKPGDRVLEIGPGCGSLTLTLLQHGARVSAVEIDEDAIRFLRASLEPRWPLTIHEGDILRHQITDVLGELEGPWKCVANLPYNVGTEIFFRLAEAYERFSVLVLMFQREVAKRLVATEKDKEYGVLSLMCRLYFDAEITMSLPPGAFFPPPRVHSAVVRCVPVAGTRIADSNLRSFFKHVVKTSFQKRRKTLVNGLKSLGIAKETLLEALQDCELSPTVRPEELSFDQFLRLSQILFQYSSMSRQKAGV